MTVTYSTPVNYRDANGSLRVGYLQRSLKSQKGDDVVRVIIYDPYRQHCVRTTENKIRDYIVDVD